MASDSLTNADRPAGPDGLTSRAVALSDGCLDTDPEVHQVLTEKVFPRQADVLTIADWATTL
jgi:hypothetical protein